jgi:hypothetical protein
MTVFIHGKISSYRPASQPPLGPDNEYQNAQEEVRDLQQRLRRIEQSNPAGSKGFTKAGIRKMIARLHEELAVYEGSEEAKKPESK